MFKKQENTENLFTTKFEVFLESQAMIFYNLPNIPGIKLQNEIDIK